MNLQVCREFQRNKCTRPDTECKFAHPASNVEVQNGRVIACYDSIKVTQDTYSKFTLNVPRQQSITKIKQQRVVFNTEALTQKFANPSLAFFDSDTQFILLIHVRAITPIIMNGQAGLVCPRYHSKIQLHQACIISEMCRT